MASTSETQAEVEYRPWSKLYVIAIARLTFDHGDSSTIVAAVRTRQTRSVTWRSPRGGGRGKTRRVEPRKKIRNELDCYEVPFVSEVLFGSSLNVA